MSYGPMFRREFQAATRKRRPFLFRSLFAALLGLVGLLIGSQAANLLQFGRILFLATIGIELVFLMFFVPASVGGAVAEEREKDTLPMLLLTRLWPIEIVLTKVVARWLSSIDLLFIGLPVLVASGWLAGLPLEMVLATLILLATSAFMASIAILASAQREQVGPARAQATAWIFGWLLGPPVVAIMPVTTGSLWGDLLAELKRLCTLVAPSSPLSLLTDNAWYYRPQVVSLEGRVAWMITLQAMFGLLAVGLAAGRLQAREMNPNWLDPTRGHRPGCGDDPVYWREFELPMRRGAGSLIGIRLRYVWILVRAILVNLLGLVAVLLSLAVPIGLLVATLYYGFAAFQEQWQSGPNASFEARSQFNNLIRAGTGMLAFLPSLGMASIVAGRITTERDKKTWDAFLTTPLTGEEILWSKARVALHGIWLGAWPLPILWVLGIACGVVSPLGVILASIDLLLIVWANLALGLYLGIRPGTTSAASSRAALSMLVCLVFHTPVLWALLISPGEFAEFASWDVRLRSGLMLAGLTVAILTGLLAWILTRRTLARFDEWVGRPIAGGAEPVEAKT
jgi:hypothetical protein